MSQLLDMIFSYKNGDRLGTYRVQKGTWWVVNAFKLVADGQIKMAIIYDGLDDPLNISIDGQEATEGDAISLIAELGKK
jgi:hypothetical protein